MSVKKHSIISAVLLVIILTPTVFAESVQDLVRQGNKKYTEGNFNEAINEYDQALVDKPEALRPKFNKANSYYRLDDIEKAMDLYEDIATKTKDMELVTKAKYNTGNCYFQRGLKQRDSDLQKALDDLKTSITFWRGVLDIEPDNKKAARNIEVARLMIKDILDQINKQKQQQDPNQPQNQNQPQQQQQQQNTPEQNQMNQQQDPNQPQEQNRGQDPNKPDDKQQESQQQQQEKEQKAAAPDATAQEILDKEQRQKKERQILQRDRYQRVEKDW